MKLTVDSLSAERGARAVFSDVSFIVESGTLLRVTGANGAGKTTLLRILAGLGSAHDGTVTWADDAKNASSLPANLAAYFVGHANAFNDALTVRENLSYCAALAGVNANDAILDAALTALGVRALINRRFGTLSQGQRKRTSLARLMLAARDKSYTRRAWLLDEPFVALDVDTQMLLASLISAELREGGLVIYTSHQDVVIVCEKTQSVAL